jgi:hypothetical protein
MPSTDEGSYSAPSRVLSTCLRPKTELSVEALTTAGAGEAILRRPGNRTVRVYVSSLRNEGSGMAPTYRVERDTGS